MALRNRAAHSGRLRAARSNGALSLVAGLVSALALTGGAVYTVEDVTCGDGGRYVRHAQHIELVSSCLNGNDLQHAPTTNGGTRGGHHVPAEHSNHRP